MRYERLIDDVPAFIDASSQSLPRVVWGQTLRADPSILSARIKERCPEAVPLTWTQNAWRLPPRVRPGNWPEYVMGWIHSQEEITLWPADLLGAKPGERVLDLCASPGSKTARVALSMEDRGMLVANEGNWRRLTPLRHNLERLGMTCTIVTCEDGTRFPDEAGSYDRVLVDAPCTSEGMARKTPLREDVSRYRGNAVGIQRKLLMRAADLVRPGGIIVYATCTYAPEENEGVISHVMENRTIEMMSITPPAPLRSTPGITQWNEHTYHPGVVHAARFWPHHNNTGGFFVAKLRRV